MRSSHGFVSRARKQVYPYFREFERGGLHTSIAGKEIINFSSNDYLGLTNHPKVKEAAKAAIDKYACGLSSSRAQATTVEHVELEKRLAAWFGFPACLMFTTGYQAMLGTIAALADKDTTLVLDAFSHACILDGSFLAAGVPPSRVSVTPAACGDAAWKPKSRYRPWVELMMRTLKLDVLECPRCQGRLTLLALVTDLDEARRFARELDDPTELPPRTAARGPPFWQSRALRRLAGDAA